jgi:hypothetical protein
MTGCRQGECGSMGPRQCPCSDSLGQYFSGFPSRPYRVVWTANCTYLIADRSTCSFSRVRRHSECLLRDEHIAL